MRSARMWKTLVSLAACLVMTAIFAYAKTHTGSSWYWGALYRSTGPAAPQPRQSILSSEIAEDSTQDPDTPSRILQHWNTVAIDAGGVAHTPVEPGENRRFGEQLGPGRQARALAIVHIAIHDAVNAIVGKYTTYTGIGRASTIASVDAAMAQAAHDTLAALYPSQQASFKAELARDLFQISDTSAKKEGIDAGRRAASAILSLRASDGSEHADPRMDSEYVASDQPGHWRQDPISLIPVALGAYWGKVKPFVMTSSSQFRAPAPPALTSAAYASAYNEVKRLGGDGVTTKTERTATQTFMGTYWGYDGTPALGAPPRLYNQIAMTIARRMNTDLDVVRLARLLALVNVAMADAAIAIWESKFKYKLWRPIAGIREADEGTGPSGLGDGNPDTIGDPTFTPLGAPASNLIGPNFTPPFPAYPSGHAGLGAALFQTLRRFYGTDRIAFEFVSDEYNGVTRDNRGNVRPRTSRVFKSLSQAEQENGQSRIYLGIHWSFDKTAGITQGRRIANYVVDHAFRRAAAQ
jgi:hypothetical protein